MDYGVTCGMENICTFDIHKLMWCKTMQLWNTNPQCGASNSSRSLNGNCCSTTEVLPELGQSKGGMELGPYIFTRSASIRREPSPPKPMDTTCPWGIGGPHINCSQAFTWFVACSPTINFYTRWPLKNIWIGVLNFWRAIDFGKRLLMDSQLRWVIANE